MTEHSTDYTTTKTHEFRIPTREEFHRYAIEIISEGDFYTNHPTPPGYVSDKITSSIRWTEKIAKENKWKPWNRKS